MKDLAIVLIVERGVLEQQACLLVESIRTWVAGPEAVDVYACCVRAGHEPTADTVQRLRSLGAEVLIEPLNRAFDYFPLCNGIHASAHIEAMQAHRGVLLLDTDTVFINPLDADLLNGPLLAMRPVDNQGIGSCGADDPQDGFWRRAFDFFDLPLPAAELLTTVGGERIRPYYNSGFVLANQLGDFFRRWKADFTALMHARIRTDSEQSRHGADYGFIEQMTLSVTAARLAAPVRIAPPTHNYPLPFHPRLRQRDGHPRWHEAVLLHYHRWFQHPDFLAHVSDPVEADSAAFAWLQARLPLQPTIDGPFKC